MPSPIPIFKDHDETFHADNCLPLAEAAQRGEIRLEALVHGHYPGRKLPPEALPGIKTVGFWDAENDQSWGLPWHRNEGIEFTFLETGTLDFAVDGRQCTLRPDDLTITRPWQRHLVGNPRVQAGRLHFFILDVGVRRPNQSWKWPPWLLLSAPDVDEMTTILRHTEQPVWNGSSELRRCVQAIGQAVEADRRGGSVSRLTIRLNEFFLLLLDVLRRKKVRLDESLSSSQRTVQLFLADLRAHPEHLSLEWTVAEMAKSCGLGVTQFVHHVRQLTNMTPAHYLNRCRLDLAAGLLREQPSRSVTEIAMECGFSSSQYFATAFHRRFGCQPRELRGLPPSRKAALPKARGVGVPHGQSGECGD